MLSRLGERRGALLQQVRAADDLVEGAEAEARELLFALEAERLAGQ